MTFMRYARWFLLALVVFGAAAQQQASAQIPVGTTKTGTFVWDGERWIPAETPPPPGAGPVVAEEVITADVAPPALPVYEQPPCPEPNLIWTPGYWHWGLLGYYWVPGAWVPAPYTGALWTPGYWGWVGGRYSFHGGYWGPHVGFYGGVNYGGGYMGIGFAGGAWNGGVFAYNTAVVRVNADVVTHVYVNRTIVEQTTIINTTNVSFNGGPNGVQHQPAPEEQIAAHEQHTAPTTFQKQHVTAAATDKSNLAKNNGGHPTNLAVAKPLPAETHAPPAGFKPPPPKPVTELAKAQAPPETVAAAKTATTKTATVAKPEAKPETTPPAKSATTPPGKPAVTPPAKSATTPPGKPAVTPAATTAPKPEAKPAVTPPAKSATTPPGKPAVTPAATTAPKPEAKPAVTPPATTAAKPEAKSATTPPAKTAPPPPAKTAPPPPAKPAITPPAKTAPKPEAKPAAKPAPKPAAKPKSDEK